MAPSNPAELEPVNRDQLLDYLASSGRPRADWRIGTEHEKFGFHRQTLAPLPYEGESGIRAMLEGLRDQFGWEAVAEIPGQPIALLRDGCSITLEPAGQLELSGAPLEHLHQTCAETGQHLREVRSVADRLGVGFLGLGFHPLARREEMPWMPKGRYAIMRRYMPTRGSLGLDMMSRTCTVQVNLDFADEADMVQKLRIGLALQPLVTALFANSPFTEGRPNGFLSYRSQIWTDTDPDRTGMLPFAFESGFGFERYLDWVLDVPMYFVYRDGRYIDVAGQSFRDFLAGKLPGLPGELPNLKDFADHLTTAFPEVRLKRYLEMRGADAGPWNRLCALPALWVGLLYDDTAQAAAWDLVRDWQVDELEALRLEVPRLGMRAPFRGGDLREPIRQMLRIAATGLQARRQVDCEGNDERVFLEPLIELAQVGRSPAEFKLDLFQGRWQGRIEPLFDEYAF
ncbi:MAG: glutamate--cysteine ligase [Xanthomonadales bacterium]|nr:glutamate--cysteine ligase [Xanthomonadales bacterium]